MSDGWADGPPPQPPANGGEFLLSLLNKTQTQQQRYDPLTSQPRLAALQHQEHQQQPLALDPAVAAVGPTVSAFPAQQWPSNGSDLPGTPVHPTWPCTLPPPNLPPSLLGFPHFPLNRFSANQFHGDQRVLSDDTYKLGFPENANHAIHELVWQQQKQPPEQRKIVFGSISNDTVENLLNGNLLYDSKICSNKEHERDSRKLQPVNPNSNSGSNLFQNRKSGFGEQRGGHIGNSSRNLKSTPPPGFSSTQGGWNRDFGADNVNNIRGSLQQNLGRTRGGYGNRNVDLNSEEERLRRLSIQDGHRFELRRQLDHPGPPAGSNLVSASDVEESLSVLCNEVRCEGEGAEKYVPRSRMRKEGGQDCEEGEDEIDDFGEELVDSLLLEDEADGKGEKDEKKKRRSSREKESRIDDRGQWLLSQRLRILKRQTPCRSDIHMLAASFLAVFESLIPAEEEQLKQKQLLELLEKLVSKEWPEARLYLYGSCANSFGFSKSDIDVCLAMEDEYVNKSEMLLKLAGILRSDNLQNVQALTRARVPIVKLMDPVTGISCDICINNVLAVVNTKLLRDYARIDVRLRQLAFIVKHWAKSRGVNETYHGTLSSYAYVLMCIHFLQQRRPPILPCLQEMDPTYSVTVDNVKCEYFDKVDMLCNFGSRNKETIAQLVWGFFNYWAYGHDYANSVVSVRTGSILSKREKDWTRRVGNDRHLICIEDPFETSHDLGRVVDKFSIRVLRGEFERAAEIMQNDLNPRVMLFEPYVRGN